MQQSPLKTASSKGLLNVVNVLADAKVDLNKVDANGFTALMWASQKGHFDVVNALIKAGADLNITAYGDNALSISFRHHPEIAKLLLKHKANPSVVHDKIKVREMVVKFEKLQKEAEDELATEAAQDKSANIMAPQNPTSDHQEHDLPIHETNSSLVTPIHAEL